VPEIPEAAIAAAADAIMSAANLNDGESEQWESRHLARTALEAAAPLLAQAVRREIEARLREHISHPDSCGFCARLGEGAVASVVVQRIDRRCGVEHAVDLIAPPLADQERGRDH